ncbi:MAG: UDP-glucose 4-epimerase GalE [Geminicoccaceae bacterium]
MADNALLVTGGAGYVGSHVVLTLRDAGWPVVVLDDLSTGRRAALPDEVELVEGDVGDTRLLADLLENRAIRAVLHFAGSVAVEESVREPLVYYRNNAMKSLALIEACVRAGIEGFVLSSTAAVYGNPEHVPVAEDASTRPLNPYGRSKLMIEQMLADADAAFGLRHVILRYFNVAGADPAGRSGLATPNATHLLKVACEAALGKRKSILLFGNDYPTPDGTCVRDFIHVSDLADAHVRALEHLLAGGTSLTLNCGYGHGCSVREVLDTVARVHGSPLAVEAAPRRPGDAVEVVAASGRIRSELGWRPRYDDLERIVRDALAFERRLGATP